MIRYVLLGAAVGLGIGLVGLGVAWVIYARSFGRRW